MGTPTPSTRSDSTFPAKEATQYSNSFSYYDQLQPAIPECSVNLNSGDSEIIWNSSASHLSHNMLVQPLVKESPTDEALSSLMCSIHWTDPLGEFPQGFTGTITFSLEDRLFKGRNVEWGNLRLPFFRARICKLLDRDYVWVVTQTMVSFESLALWAVHTVLTYKVYPGFWGRRLVNSTSYGLQSCVEQS